MIPVVTVDLLICYGLLILVAAELLRGLARWGLGECGLPSRGHLGDLGVAALVVVTASSGAMIWASLARPEAFVTESWVAPLFGTCVAGLVVLRLVLRTAWAAPWCAVLLPIPLGGAGIIVERSIAAASTSEERAAWERLRAFVAI